MNFPGLAQLRCLKNTVRAEYGHGLSAWFNCIYYSLFRVNTFHIFRLSLDDLPDMPIDVPGISFHSPSPAELDGLRATKELPREFFCDRLHSVRQCCIAKVDGEIAYIHWVYFQGDFSRFLKLGRDAAEINYVLTLPPFRGRGIGTAAFVHTARDMKKLGIKNLYAVVHNENIASIKSFTRAGFVKIGSTVSVGPFNRKIEV